MLVFILLVHPDNNTVLTLDPLLFHHCILTIAI